MLISTGTAQQLTTELDYLQQDLATICSAVAALQTTSDPEVVRAQTRVLRRALDGLEDHADDAQTLLSGLEQDVGLVRDDGSRIDD